MNSQKGFSLIELIIVALIIGIIATIAIPNLLAARRAANEASAISSLRTYHGAQIIYQATGGAGNYAGDFTLNNTAFTTLRNNGMLDSVLGSGVKSGYNFTGIKMIYSPGTQAQFGGRATPVLSTGITATGKRDFAILTEGILYWSWAGGISMGVNTTGGLAQTGGVPLNN